ncbi:MAG: hypothetical protein ACFFDK_08980 [Promethearchaeota archaeon]
MIKSEFSNKLTEQAFKNFENIKESLKGLFEILNLAVDGEENEVYYNLGVDNISGLYENFLELMFNDYGARQVMKALRNSEIDLAIPLNDPVKGESENEGEREAVF